MTPDFSFEEAVFARGIIHVAGVDEVGRGPLAGPVTAAAVILDPTRIPPGLNDSKKLNAAQREALAVQITQTAIWAVAHASVEEIDSINILQAAHLAMCRAVSALAQQPAHVLVDGNRIPQGLQIPADPIVKGDARCLSIAAASIIAKVWRDRIMVDLAQQHPGYGWEKNAGYPTKLHLQSIHSLGITQHHRRSFKPVHNILCKDITGSG